MILLVVPISSAFAASPIQDAVDKLLGIKYKYGGTTTSGFDCSGFTQYVFGLFDIELPHQSRSQAHLGYKVDKSELRVGDLLFFNTDGKQISHVGVYMGDGKFAHAANDGVQETSLTDKYYAKRYVTARRITGATTYETLTGEKPPSVQMASSKD